MQTVLRSSKYASFLLSIWELRSFSRTLIKCGLANSVRTEHNTSLYPYSTKDNSPALKTKHTEGLSK